MDRGASGHSSRGTCGESTPLSDYGSRGMSFSTALIFAAKRETKYESGSLSFSLSARRAAAKGFGLELAKKLDPNSLASCGASKGGGEGPAISASDVSYNAICARKAATCSAGSAPPWCADSEGGLLGGPRLVNPLIPKFDSRVLQQGLSRRCGCLDSAPPTIKLAMRSPVLECDLRGLKSPLPLLFYLGAFYPLSLEKGSYRVV
ncbi:hypothetical protein B296_00009536 [Ensete ventricosum]|uniref:Uncharacterized protein n=1 Tax=Ensete ventricosum TaxID=4639 RepID=A0A427AM69_ENSVE|nr:hypothetical protein B296_00009536 [Ensete ventricosum]